MRRLTMLWDGSVDGAERIVRENLLSHGSRMRVRDVIAQVFVPRYVRSSPPDFWRPLGILEHAGWSKEALLPLHYYAAAVAEPLLWDFVCDELCGRFERGLFEVGPTDVHRFLMSVPAEHFPKGRWGESANARVARGLLAALRDFGVLSGAVRKRMASVCLPVESFALLAMVRHLLGIRGSAALGDPCWRLFRLGDLGVEHLFMEAHQRRLLSYHAAGSVIRIEFPHGTLETYAQSLAQGKH